MTRYADRGQQLRAYRALIDDLLIRVGERTTRAIEAARLGDSYDAALEAHRAELAAQEARLLATAIAHRAPDSAFARTAALAAADATGRAERARAAAIGANWEHDQPEPAAAIGGSR